MDTMKKLYRSALLLLCMALLLPAISSLTVFAADGDSSDKEVSWEDKWKDTLYPAYMSTSFKTIKDRLRGDETIAPMKLYCVVKGMAFYVDTITGEVVVLTLEDSELTKEAIDESGEIPAYTAYYSTNPYNAGSSQSSQGANSSNSIKEELYSQLIVQYAQNNSDMSMNSFKDSAANNQITTSNIRGGIRVEYSIGREQVIYLVPRLIIWKKFENLAAQIRENSDDPRDENTFRAFYVHYSLDDETKAEKTKMDYLKQYPVLEKFRKSDVDDENDPAYDKGGIYGCEQHITTKELLRLENIVKLYTDYTIERMDEDHAETEYVSTEENPPLFKLAIEYKVEDDDGSFTIRLNAGNIRFQSDMYALSNVVLLPYGGAGNTKNEGYIFTPDGSGSIISFEDVATAGNFQTVSPMYGIDNIYHTVTGANKETLRLPVYGIVEWADNGSHEEQQPVVDDEGNIVYKTDSEGNILTDDDGNQIPETETVTVRDVLKIGYLAVIEEGDSLAKIAIKNGGSTHQFVSIYTTFNPRPQDTYVLEGGLAGSTNATWTVEAKRKYTGDYKIRMFMLKEDVTYSEMARTYRNYLVGTGALTKLENASENLPLYLETLGAMRINDSVLGIPVSKMIALTSFEHDEMILEELKAEGITDVNLKLNGWVNGGLLFTTAANRVKIEKVLGGDDGFKKLLQYAKSGNVTVFPDFDFSYVENDELFDGFTQKKHNAQTIDGRNAYSQEYDPAWQAFIETGLGILSPNVIEEFYEGVYEDYEKFDVGSISVCTLGRDLNSDFDDDAPLTREDSKTLVKRLLSKIQEQNKRVLVSGGNAYTLPYVTDIIEVPLDDSGSRYACGSVPFMGMVLHGYKEFAGSALNLAGDYQFSLLKSIENGASPYFVVAYENTSELKGYSYSSISKYYSIRYLIWKDSIVQAYNLLNKALKSVRTETIESHEFLDHENKVAKVTYSNGDVFYLNYLTKEYTHREGDTLYDIASYGFIKVSADGTVLKYDGNKLTVVGEEG